MTQTRLEIKTLGDLERVYKQAHPNGHFFDAETLKFFGERRSEMRVLKDIVTVTDICGKKHQCYVLSAMQHPGAPLKPRRKYHYFDIETLEDVCT